jgi:hypothetical protein
MVLTIISAHRQAVHVEHIGHQHEKRRVLLRAVKVAIGYQLFLKTDQPATDLRVLLLLRLQLLETGAQTVSHPQPRVLHQAAGEGVDATRAESLQDLDLTLHQ